jgi:hypothetical protein
LLLCVAHMVFLAFCAFCASCIYLLRCCPGGTWDEFSWPGGTNLVTALHYCVQAFHRDESRKSLELPPTLTKNERHLVHILARRFQLKSKSIGKGDKRYATLTKTDAGASPRARVLCVCVFVCVCVHVSVCVSVSVCTRIGLCVLCVPVSGCQSCRSHRGRPIGAQAPGRGARRD